MPTPLTSAAARHMLRQARRDVATYHSTTREIIRNTYVQYPRVLRTLVDESEVYMDQAISSVTKQQVKWAHRNLISKITRRFKRLVNFRIDTLERQIAGRNALIAD
jgi:hypothetical protein